MHCHAEEGNMLFGGTYHQMNDLFSEEMFVDSFFEFCFVLVYSGYLNSLIPHGKCHPSDFKFFSLFLLFFCSVIDRIVHTYFFSLEITQLHP